MLHAGNLSQAHLQALLRINNKAITTKLSIAYLYIHNILLISICELRFQINIRFRGLKDGAYSRGGRLFEGGLFGGKLNRRITVHVFIMSITFISILIPRFPKN